MKIYKTKEYRVLAAGSDKMLTAGAEDLITAEAQDPEKHQLWKFAAEKNDTYRLVNADSKKVLDIIDGGDVNGAWTHQWETTETDSQLWTIEEEGEYVRLRSVSSGKYLDVALEDGTHVQIWEKGGDNQLWKIEVAEKEKTAIKEKEPSAIKHPDPTAIKEKEPSAIKHPDPTAIKEKEPAAIKHPDPTAIKEKEPSAIKHPDPTAIKEKEPSAIKEKEQAEIKAADTAAAQEKPADTKKTTRTKNNSGRKSKKQRRK